ncbi:MULTISPECIES: MFS transporter [unclassified Nocardiopsis]|uniref:MFS transporter n=1 Tax=Nocardiopsis TaxID=2013 RepID=UPI00387B1BDA
MNPVVGLLLAETLSYTATRLALIAIPWFVLETTGSPVYMGVVAFFEVGSYALARLLGGPLLDRWGQRVMSIRADLVGAVAVLCVPVAHAAGVLSFPLLLVLVTVIGLAAGPGEASKVSLAPAVAAATGMRIERVTGLTGTVDRLSQTVGPLVAGGVVAAVGTLPALYGNAVLLVLSALVLGAVRVGAPVAEAAGGGYLNSLLSGFRVIWCDPTLRTLVLVAAVTNAIDMAVFSLVLPVWVFENGMGPEVVGLVGGALGAASVLGSLVATAVGHRLPRRLTFFVGLALAGPPHIAVLALDGPLWVVLAVFAASGVFGGLLNPILGAVLFERLPPEAVGRGTATIGALVRLAAPLGGPLMGTTVALVGIAPAVLAGAGIYLLFALAPLFGRAAHGLDRPEPVPEPTAQES